ncbi:FHA domain-containing protein [Desulfosarcina sp.]|uniref:FHA domain-containing protein n=1 Tax=Desulfosarcina sp. TaxID=2027861 RepID=UPI0035670611
MAMLVLTHEGLTIKRIPLDQAELRIGRKTDSDVFIDDMLASQSHAKIEKVEYMEDAGRAGYFIEDLNSTNHTYINGAPIDRKKLVHNDVIRIGKHTFKFLEDAAESADKTTKLRKSWIPGVYYTAE